MEDTELDNAVIQIRDKLQKDNIKLWTEPYYTESNGPSEQDLKVLAEDYSVVFKLPYQQCYTAILELQTNAVNKLKQRDRFKEFGIATLKIKAVSRSETRIFPIETSLSSLGSDLRSLISSNLKKPHESVKLIASGRIIKETESLVSQSIKNGHLILAIVLTETPLEVKQSEDQLKEIESVKADAQLLLKEDNEHYFELEDQYGNRVNIPKVEKKALMLAMALHEKGRSALKKNEYAKALIYFLEADNEFRRCNSQLLEHVDNYALLDLDTAWCYLCLQSVSHLPEAFERLKKCEERFNRSYGSNLERVVTLKGTAGNEEALLLRLHLMQAIVLFHQNKRTEAKSLLKEVELQLKDLQVDENKILSLTELGFSIPEARVGLRATRGDVNQAAVFINENRERKTESRKKALAEKILQKEKEKLGKCVDGKQYVDPNFLKMLINMGYNKEVARRALQNCNNIISDSVQFIHQNPCPGPSTSISQEILKLINDLVPQLEDAGFDPRMAQLALKKHQGDILKAAEELIENGGFIEGDLKDMEDNGEVKKRKFKDEIEYQKKEEAYERLKEDISTEDEDYLDLSLKEEEIFLLRYLSLLEND